MPCLPSLRANASLLDVFKAHPETSRPLIEFHEALLRGPSPFTEAERELIAACVSGTNHCRSSPCCRADLLRRCDAAPSPPLTASTVQPHCTLAALQ